MTKREELLTRLWNNSINWPFDAASFDEIASKKCDRRIPLSDTGEAINRLIAAGGSDSDIRLILRFAAYGGVFDTLIYIDEMGVEKKDLEGLHAELLSADPSGKEGRPGSAPPVTPKRTGLIY